VILTRSPTVSSEGIDHGVLLLLLHGFTSTPQSVAYVGHAIPH
jgi:esterase/lipase